MNIHNMKLLRSQLARLDPDKFHMGEWTLHPEDIEHDRRLFEPQLAERVERCGTVACIAGWASLLNGGDSYDLRIWAGDWLGLTSREASHLFYGHWAKDKESLSEITLADAVAQLDLLLAQQVKEEAR